MVGDDDDIGRLAKRGEAGDEVADPRVDILDRMIDLLRI